jgi:outer membrane protein
MRARLILGWLLVLTMVAAIGYAQEAPARKLSLAEALETARRNNPDYLTTLSARAPASWSLTNATAGLFTPTASVSGGYAYQAATNGQNFQGFQIPATPSYHQSSLSFRLAYQLSGTSVANRGYASAQLSAADQDIAGARTVLETSVKQEYINLLEARAQADLAEHVVTRAAEVLNLAQARYNVGQGTMIDVRRAQVDKGTADVQLLQARQNVEVEVLKLYQWLGVPAPEPPNVEPTDTFPVAQPAYNQDSLVALGLQANPALRAFRAREGAARWNVRAAYSQYLPSLQASASTGKSWITQGASSYNQTSPWYLSLGVSLPIYDAFSRNLQISQANAQEESLRQSIRSRELLVRANVSAAYLALITAYQTIAVQADNRAAAEEALSLATQRYRVGSGSIIELLDARVTSETAGANYINAVYNYHKAIAALEQAVGQPLR